MSVRRALGWLSVVAVLELVTRAIVYGMAPSADVSARELGGRLGGPGFAEVLLVAIGLGAVLATGMVWLASIGVRERWELAAERPVGGPPRVSVVALVGRALALTAVGWLSFAAIETAVHVHEGLGLHGLECLVGPVHRNALPVVAGLAVLCSALIAAARLVLAWMRRTVGRFARPRAFALVDGAAVTDLRSALVRRVALPGAASPRGPPLPVV